MYFENLRARLLDHLRRRLRNGELTERGLARLTGVSQSHMHNALKGAKVLSPELADQILRRLEITLLDLFEPGELERRRPPARAEISERARATAPLRGRSPAPAEP